MYIYVCIYIYIYIYICIIYADYCCHITYPEKVLRLPRTSIKSTEMQSSNIRRSKHINLHTQKPEILPRFLSYSL